MAEVRVSKFQLRNGNIDDIPVLDKAEMGYASDVNRLFIGTEELTIGAGDGATVEFQLPTFQNLFIPPESLETLKIFVDGSERSDVSFGVNTVTFSNPPAASSNITMKFNLEIETLNYSKIPFVLSLNGNVSDYTDTGISIDYNAYDSFFIKYTLSMDNDSDLRVGELRGLIDSNTDTFKIDDQYNSLINEEYVEFNGSIHNGMFNLTYRNSSTSSATFKYIFELWKK